MLFNKKNIVYNTEIRFPIFSTIFKRPIGNSFLRNLQIIAFADAGIATNDLTKIKNNVQIIDNFSSAPSFMKDAN